MNKVSIIILALTTVLAIAGCSKAPAAQPAATNKLVIDLAGQRMELVTDSQGRVMSPVAASSADGEIRLALGRDAVVRDRSGQPLPTIQAVINPSPPPPPKDAYIIGRAYDLRPEGATFQPWLALTLSYNPRELPRGVSADSLYIAYHNGIEWRTADYRQVDAASVTTHVDHFTTFALIGGKPVVATPTTLPVGTMVGNLAPDFNLPSLTGQTVTLSSRRGQPVVLNFWATWCPPCVAEMPFLQQVYQQWSAKGLVLLGIDVAESPDKVKDFVQRQRLSFPVLLDTNGEAAGKYGVSAIPTTFFIDGNGIIRDRNIGAFPSKSAIENRLGKIMP